MVTKEKVKERAYYIQLNKGGFEKTEGKPVVIPGFESIDLFIHKDDHIGMWKVSEISTGGSIGKGTTPKKAVAQATSALEFLGMERVQSQIKSAIRKYGKAPQGEF